MAYNVKTIAKWFIENDITSSENSYDGNLTLNKLIYFADAMNFTINDEKLVDESPSGYANGPVYQSIYVDHRHYNLMSVKANEDKISEETTKLLKIIKFAFGSYKPQYLTKLTHEQSPWKVKQVDCEKNDYNPLLSFDDLSEIEKKNMLEIYNMYNEIDLDNYSVDKIGENVFVFVSNIVLEEEDYKELENLEVENDSIFVEKIDGELIYA
ncbi:MAG: Panacea domain-containing protein [Staphylococcus equorum]